MSHRWVRIALLISVALAIMVLSLIPDPLLTFEWMSGADKVQHWIAYTLLGFIVYLTIQSIHGRRILYIALSIFACTMYGGLIEVLQSFTGRNPDPIDFFVNMFGATVGSIASLGFIEASLDSRRRNKGEVDS